MRAARWQRDDGPAALSHHTQGPGRELHRPQIVVAQAVSQCDMGHIRCKPQVDLFLDPGCRFCRLNHLHVIGVLLDIHRFVVGGIRSGMNFWRMPEAMPTVYAPLVAAGFSEHIFKLAKLIIAPIEAKTNDARADVRGHDQLDLFVGQPVAVGPATVAYSFHFVPPSNRWWSNTKLCLQYFETVEQDCGASLQGILGGRLAAANRYFEFTGLNGSLPQIVNHR